MALFDDFYNNFEEYEHKRSNEERQELDAKLPGIVQSIRSLPMKITVSDSKAQHLLDRLAYLRDTGNSLQAGTVLLRGTCMAEALPR
jgi:hypothetical protein